MGWEGDFLLLGKKENSLEKAKGYRAECPLKLFNL